MAKKGYRYGVALAAVILVMAGLYFESDGIGWLRVVSILVNGLLMSLLIYPIIRRANLNRLIEKIVYPICLIYSVFVYWLVTSINLTVYQAQAFQGGFHVPEGRLQLIPFGTISTALNQENFHLADLQVLGNGILFAPLGFCFLMLGITDSKSRTILVLCGVSFSIEVYQLIQTVIDSGFDGAPYRTTDIDDLMLNTLGAWIGTEIYELMRIVKNRRKLSG